MTTRAIYKEQGFARNRVKFLVYTLEVKIRARE